MARAWIITHDYIFDLGADVDSSDVGTIGPKDAPDEMVAQLKKGKGYSFRMYDDDKNLYYRGRAIWDDDSDDSGPYGPLGDFGMPNAGCTLIRYNNHPEFDCA